MTFGLLARDSIVDLLALEREASSEASFDEQTSSERPALKKGGLIGDKSDIGESQQSQTIPISSQTIVEDVHQTQNTREFSSRGKSPLAAAFQDDDYYPNTTKYYDSAYYGPPVQAKPLDNFWKSLLPCLFPWTTHEIPPLEDYSDADIAEESESRESSKIQATGEDSNVSRTSSVGENDDVSIGSDALGEQLSTRERQAVLARLRLAQPEAGEEGSGSDLNMPSQKKGFLNELPQQDMSTKYQPLGQEKRHRSILKKHGNQGESAQKQLEGPGGRPSNAPGKSRRSLFPQVSYETIKDGSKKPNKKLTFSPMARVVSVKSRNDMSPEDKAAIWWQRADYEDFRKTGRIIAKAMMEGGSELWLSSERANGQSKSKDSSRNSVDNDDPITSQGDKWWHKFGHSRRGLEHVVSMEEGRQRQMNVRNAIRSVIDEQSRQKMYNKEDPEKLRMVSLNYTSWARDLALASGSSDADAVKSSFSNERKTREFYLLKMSRAKAPVTSAMLHMPEFMQPNLHGVPGPTAPHRLDANTSAQIRYRQNRNQQQKTNAASTTMPVLERNGSFTSEHSGSATEQASHRESMAHRAAGFSADGAEKVDMAAVLSGMGAVPCSSQIVSTA